MLGQTTLMFAAAGLQFWTIAYYQVVLGVEAVEAQYTFVIVLFSAMVPGVVLGAKLADYYGGYKGQGMQNALSLCVLSGTLATIFSLSLTITFEKNMFTLLTWLFFFSGAPIMPIAAGIIIGCVPKFAQNSASALYCIFQNIVGLSLAPVLSGHIMEQYKNKRQGMIKGYQLLLFAGILLVLLFVGARAIVRRYMARMRLAEESQHQNVVGGGGLINIEDRNDENGDDDN